MFLGHAVHTQTLVQGFAFSAAAPYHWESEMVKKFTMTKVYNLLDQKVVDIGRGEISRTTELGLAV